MTDEELRTLERAAEDAAPEVVRWIQALRTTGGVPVPKAALTSGADAWDKATGDRYVLLGKVAEATVMTASYANVGTPCWLCQPHGRRDARPILLPAALLTPVQPVEEAARSKPAARSWWDALWGG